MKLYGFRKKAVPGQWSSGNEKTGEQLVVGATRRAVMSFLTPAQKWLSVNETHPKRAFKG